MRQDFEFFIPIEIAQHRAGRKKKRAILTGSMVTAFLFKAWLTGFALLGMIAVLNLVQRKGKA